MENNTRAFKLKVPNILIELVTINAKNVLYICCIYIYIY
jgi:hypothetical protein